MIVRMASLEVTRSCHALNWLLLYVVLSFFLVTVAQMALYYKYEDYAIKGGAVFHERYVFSE